MRYRICHTTRYHYAAPVDVSHNEARLLPRATSSQSVRSSKLTVGPLPADRFERLDYFGNHVQYFALESAHSVLTAVAEADVEVFVPD